MVIREIVPFPMDVEDLAFRVADLTMLLSLQNNISLEEAVLILINSFEEYKESFTKEEREVVVSAVQQIQDVLLRIHDGS